MEQHERLKQARINAGYAAAPDAARAMGISTATYYSHENGSRKLKADAARRYARRFRVSAEWLLYGTGAGATATAATGFSEPDLAPYAGRDRINIGRAAAPDAARPDVYSARAGSRELGIEEGDLVVVDLNAHADEGDMAVITLGDPESRTTLARIWGSLAVETTEAAPHRLDDPEGALVIVQGKVAALIRRFDARGDQKITK